MRRFLNKVEELVKTNYGVELSDEKTGYSEEVRGDLTLIGFVDGQGIYCDYTFDADEDDMWYMYLTLYTRDKDGKSFIPLAYSKDIYDEKIVELTEKICKNSDKYKVRADIDKTINKLINQVSVMEDLKRVNHLDDYNYIPKKLSDGVIDVIKEYIEKVILKDDKVEGLDEEELTFPF